ncbi:MAG TPA: TonB-dependent receptor [Longimicrobiales bacterium]|nr:TonB-dependent receptor [Longimicrobiales bacterium]
MHDAISTRWLRPTLVAAALALGAGEAWAMQQYPDVAVRAETQERLTPPLERGIAVRFRDTPLADALRTVARESGVSIAFSDRLLPPVRVTLQTESMPVRGVLQTLLNGTGLMLEVLQSGQVLILPRTADAPIVGMVQGRVVSASDGQPIRNAEVRVIGMPETHTVGTNGSGAYIIADIPAGTHWVRAEALGFGADSQSVTVRDDDVATVNFRLAVDAIALDPLSATVSTGTLVDTERRTLGTSISVVTAEEIEQSGATELVELFQGRVPGVTSFTPSGANGAGGHIRVRGVSSIMGDQAPLIYVDGVPVDNGSSAGNRAGEDVLAHPTVTNAGAGAHVRLQEIPLDQIERIEVVKGSAATTMYGSEAINGVIQIFTKRGVPGDMRITARVEQGISTVNLDDSFVERSPYAEQIRSLFSNPHTQRYNVQLSGGESRLAYTLGADHGRDDGVVMGNEASETSVHGSFSTLGSEKLSLRLSASLLQRTYSSLDYSALFDFVDVNAEVPAPPGIESMQDALERGSRSETDVQRVIASANLTWRPLPILQNQFTVGLDRSDELQLMAGQPLRDAFSSTFQAENIRRDFDRLTGRYVGTLSYPAEGTFTSTLSIGAEGQHSEVRNLRIRGVGLPSPGISGLDFAESITSGPYAPIEQYSAIATVGFFVQEQVGLWNRLYLTGGLRADGSSAFGDDFGLQVYPKISASYVVEPVEWWSGKLRAAWGQSGKLPTAFAKVQTYALSRGTYYDRPIVSLADYGNPDLRPELGTEIEFGIENYFLDNLASLEVNYWQQETEDALLRGRIPFIEGFSAPLMNVAGLKSSGIEAIAQVTPIRTEDVSLTLGATLTHLIDNGIITSLGGDSTAARVGNLYLGMQVGESINAVTFTSQINNRRVYYGSREPTTYGGAHADLRYRRFQLSTNLSFGTGGIGLDHIQAQEDFAAGLITSSFRTFDPQVAEARYLVPTDYLRIDAIRLAYDVPPSLLRGVEFAQLWVQARNPFVWDRWANGDATTISPVGTAGGQAPLYLAGTLERGFSTPRNFSLGARVSF